MDYSLYGENIVRFPNNKSNGRVDATHDAISEDESEEQRSGGAMKLQSSEFH